MYNIKIFKKVSKTKYSSSHITLLCDQIQKLNEKYY